MRRKIKRRVNKDIGPCMWYIFGDYCSVEGGDDDCEYYLDGRCTKYKQGGVVIEERRRADVLALTDLVLGRSG